MRTQRGLRPDLDDYFLQMALLVAKRATCSRRAVGCVLTNLQGHVLATGYNGVCHGEIHCIDVPCAGADQPSGIGLHLCQAIHAEANALLQCRNIGEIHSCYSTTSPCIACMRLLANTSVQRVVFLEEYPHVESKTLAVKHFIDWVHRPN